MMHERTSYNQTIGSSNKQPLKQHRTGMQVELHTFSIDGLPGLFREDGKLK
jgi:hypothetical protein